jgi:hypothetical protein
MLLNLSDQKTAARRRREWNIGKRNFYREAWWAKAPPSWKKSIKSHE